MAFIQSFPLGYNLHWFMNVGWDDEAIEQHQWHTLIVPIVEDSRVRYIACMHVYILDVLT